MLRRRFFRGDCFLRFHKAGLLRLASQIGFFHGVAFVFFELRLDGFKTVLRFLFFFGKLAAGSFEVNDVAARFHSGFQLFRRFVAGAFQLRDFSAPSVFMQQEHSCGIELRNRFLCVDALIGGE